MQLQVDSLNNSFIHYSLTESLIQLANLYPNKIVFSTSFGIEDQVITNEIATNKIPISIFTLDTGRLFAETYSTWNTTIERHKIKINTFYPNEISLQKFITENGPNSFFESLENRKECCHIRKVEPLKRALNGQHIWITGIRAEQSNNRQLTDKFEWDSVNNIIKFHPLLDWSFEQVKEYIQLNQVAYNPLHDKGFVSIGCAPCTRAIKPGEDFRAGRWWWEENDKKECGLHQHHSSKV